MNRNLTNLLKLLATQENNLKMLYHTSYKKQGALVNNNHTGLDEAISEEEKLILVIQQTEKNRLELFEKLKLEYGSDSGDKKVFSLLNNMRDKLSDEQVKQLESTEASIKRYIYEIKKLNHHNIFLIQHSRQFINETITSLISAQKKSILDTRV